MPFTENPSFPPQDNGLSSDRAGRWALAAVVLLALIPRLLLFVSLPPILHADSDSYFAIAQQFWNSRVADLSRRTPLYPLFLSLVGRPARAGLFAVVAFQHLLGIASALLLYFIARRAFASRDRSSATAMSTAAAMLSGAAIYPALLEQSILSESLYTFLLLCSVWLLIVWFQEDRNWAAVACGATLGFAALTRPLAAGFFLVFTVTLFPLLGARRALRFALAAGMAIAVVLSPLLVRNYRAMGRFALTESMGRNLITVADSFVDYDHGVELRVKSVYKEFLKDKRGPDAVVIYSAMPRLRQATGWSDAEIDRALDRIAREAIRAHPLAFLLSRLRRLPLLFRDPAASEWYALHPETYLPFVEFVGRINPELVSRSVALRPLANTRFDLAAETTGIFAIDFTNGWLLALPLAGIVCMLRREPRGAAWFLAAVLAYSSLATVLLQPPNARYRIPTLCFEILFGIAGIALLASVLVRVVRRLISARRANASGAGGETSTGATVLDSQKASTSVRAAAVAVLLVIAIVVARAVLATGTQSVFSVSDFQPGARAAAAPAGNNPPELRELPIAGKKLPVLYWKANSGGAGGTVSAEVPITGGLAYRLRSAYSC